MRHSRQLLHKLQIRIIIALPLIPKRISQAAVSGRAIPKHRIDHGASRSREPEKELQRIRRGPVRARIRVHGFLVERIVRIEDPRNVVFGAVFVPRAGSHRREVQRVERVAEVQRRVDHPAGEHGADELVGVGPEGGVHGLPVGYVVPVETEIEESLCYVLVTFWIFGRSLRGISGAYKTIVSRAHHIRFPVSVSEVADQWNRSKQREHDDRNPFVAECCDGYNAEELKRLLRDGRVLVHGVEERDVGQDSRVVDVGRSDKNVSEQSSETISDHLGSNEEKDAPAWVDFTAVVKLHGTQWSKTVRSVALCGISQLF
jgi:hypothetical protein